MFLPTSPCFKWQSDKSYPKKESVSKTSFIRSLASRKSTKIPKDASNNNNNNGTIELGHGIVESMGTNEENNPNNNNNNNNKNDQATRGENKSTDRLVNILIKIKNISKFTAL